MATSSTTNGIRRRTIKILREVFRGEEMIIIVGIICFLIGAYIGMVLMKHCMITVISKECAGCEVFKSLTMNN